MTNSQLLKGTLEGCVLAIISTKEVYGYELVQVLRNQGFPQVIGGTIYPLLQKLEKRALLKSTMHPSEDGPDRKYYQITDNGRAYLMNFQEEWQQLNQIVTTILTTAQEDLHE